MRFRIPDMVLIVALAVGGVFAWQTALERAHLESYHERLTRATGDLPITDPTKAHFRALETGEPLHFAWRVYAPLNYSLILRSRSGTTSHVSNAGSQDLIARVRLRSDPEGNWETYQSFAGSSTRGTFGSKRLAEILRGRSDRILVEQLGAKEVATVDSDGSAVLLRLTLPDDMRAEARKVLSPYDQQAFLPDLFRLEVGPEKPKPAPPPPPGS